MARSTEMEMTPGRDKITTATSSASLYDNVNNPNATPGKTPKIGDKQKEKQNEICQTIPKTANIGIGTVTVGSQVRILLICIQHCDVKYYIMEIYNGTIIALFSFFFVQC